MAIPVCRSDEDAAALAVAGCAVALLVSALFAAVLALHEAPLAAALGIPGFGHVLWFTPPMLLLWGVGLVLAHWGIRRGRFRINAGANLALSASQALGQLLLGLGSATAAALVAGYALGSLVRTALLARVLSPADRTLLRAVSWKRVAALARAHWHYPVYSGSSGLLQSTAQMLPAVLIAVLFGPAAAGWFGLGQRITGMPTRMMAEAAAQAFLAEIAQAEGPVVYRLFKRAALRFFLLGLAVLSPLLLVGPPLFAFVFGEPWRGTGTIVQILIPLHLVRFVVLAVAQTINIAGRQHLHLIASLLTAAALFASFGLGAWLELGLLETLFLYSLASTAAFLFYFGCAWHAARRVTRTGTGLAPERTETAAW
jgi:O-antigen/teichoic acid export membrane protein